MKYKYIIILVILFLVYLLFNNKENFEEPRQEIIIRKPYDKFYAPVYSVLITDQIVDRTQYEVNDLLKKTKLRKFQDPNLLDLGAGAANHLIFLEKKNIKSLKLTGIDKSVHMLNETRKRMKKYKIPSDRIRLLQRNIDNDDLFMPGSYSHVTCYYFTIYMLDIDKLVENLKVWLRTGGWFAVHMVDLYKFDPVLDASSPFVGTTVQKYVKNRITESQINFKHFDYYSNFKIPSGEESSDAKYAYFEETFKFHKRPLIRKQKHELRIIKMNEFIKKITKQGFYLKATTHLNGLNYPFQYILYFQKK
tara:strand:+ start:5175 stop:6092 length:918 start_codon:yes stop_codon:yes gene_type:complete